MWKRRILVLLAVCVATVIGLLGFADETRTGESFRTAKIDRGDIQKSVSATGELKAVVTVKVGSEISGQISELLADFNSEVKAGEVIARINAESFEARVRQAGAELAVAEATVGIRSAALDQAKANLQNAREQLAAQRANHQRSRVHTGDLKQDYDRKQQLRTRGVVSISVVDKSRAVWEAAVQQTSAAEAQVRAQNATILARMAQVDMAEAEVIHANAQIRQRQAALRLAEVNLESTYIRSPVDGVVIGRDVDVGQTVAASLQAPVLFTIARDLREMQVETFIDEADIGQVRAGHTATFTVDSFPRRQFKGSVAQIRKQPRSVQNVVTYTVVLTADNSDLQLLPGMTANVEIIVSNRPGVLRIPNAALRFLPPGATPVTASSQPSGPTSGNLRSGGGDRRARAAARLKHLAGALVLDEGQKSQLRDLSQAMGRRIRSLRENGIRGNDLRNAARQLRQQFDRDVMSILTHDQKVKYRVIIENRQSNPARPGRVWIIENGEPRAVTLFIGVGDGRFTEMVRGDLTEGQEVLTGIVGSPEKRSGRIPGFGF